MPLSEKARIEVYLPDVTRLAYEDLLDAFEQEFTYTFGGCTTVRGLEGNYLSRLGLRMGIESTSSTRIPPSPLKRSST